tara:strand:+ start:1277 stop:1681 length:405 start_codon:yes stop_codon:yes gene_type:complete
MAKNHKLQCISNFRETVSGNLDAAMAVAGLVVAVFLIINPAQAQAPCGSNRVREYSPESHRKNCMTLPKATKTRTGVLRESQQLRIQNLKKQQTENRRRTLAPRKNTDGSSAQRIRQRKDILKDRIIINRQRSQ